MNKLDEEIMKSLSQHTEKEVGKLQEEIWANLEQELFKEKGKEREVEKMNDKNRKFPVILAIAVALFILFTLQTAPGMAFVKGVKELFVPEKEIIQNIEGEDEITEVQLNEGQNAEYVIYIDETRYKLNAGEGIDKVTPIEDLPEEFPEVSMEIKQDVANKPEDLVKDIEAELKMEFQELRAIETVTEPVEGFLLHGLNGTDWDSKVVHLYVISNGKGGSYVIRENYFLEAAEGHGARFYQMLESFEVIE